MTGKFVILFLQKSEAEKTNKMAMQSLPPFELPTKISRNEIICLVQALSSRS